MSDKQILRDCWCEDTLKTEAEVLSLDTWRSLAKFERVLTDRKMRPVRIVEATRTVQYSEAHGEDRTFAMIAIECEPGHYDTPFWKWWFDEKARMPATPAAA